MSAVTAAAKAHLSDWHAARPTMALMGEFSAGKSTLLNALVGADLLPTRATATRMPAVWLTAGPANEVIGLRDDGVLESLDETALTDGALETYVVLRIADPAPILTDVDIIDTPGISDIRLKAGIIPALADHMDFIIWCSSATQFWRQSERAMWRKLPDRLRDLSALAVTGADRLAARDLDRVLKRGRKETRGLFATVLPIAGLKAIAADGDISCATWRESGAPALLEHISKTVRGLEKAPAAGARTIADNPERSRKAPPAKTEGEAPTTQADTAFQTLRHEIESLSELPQGFQLSTFLTRLLDLLDQEKSLPDDRRDLAARILRADDVNDPRIIRSLRQMAGELSDFADGNWCRLD